MNLLPETNSPGPEIIYRLAEPSDWLAAQMVGHFASQDLAREGFIHACTAEQLAGVARRYYAGREGLWLLELETGPLAGLLKWEPATQGELFPHLYGPIPLAAIRRFAAVPPLTAEVLAAADMPLKDLNWENLGR